MAVKLPATWRMARPARKLPWHPTLLAGVLGVCMLSHVCTAQAWVCARVEDDYGDPAGPALSWTTRTIPFAFNSAGTTHLDPNQAWDTLRAALAVWQASTLRSSEPTVCADATAVTAATATDIIFSEQAPTPQALVGYNYLEPDNNENMLIFRDTSWRYALSGPSIDIIALTTLTYNVITGNILDADIEFNTADFPYTLGDSDVQFDLMNTAVHEIGHMLGFAHSTDASAAMYGSASTGETLKRALSCDDATILWYRYPAGSPTQSCPINQTSLACGMCAHPNGLAYNVDMKVVETNDGRGGCSCRSLSGDSSALLAVVAVVVFRRKHRAGMGRRA